LQALLQKLYECKNHDFVIKYQDDEGDMITIGNELDLEEAFRWSSERNAKELKNNGRLVPLHLVIINGTMKDDDSTSSLVGITDLFIESMKSMSISEGSQTSQPTQITIPEQQSVPTQSEPLMEIVNTLENGTSELLANTEWRGHLTYLNSGESFPLTLRVLKSKNRTKEGLMYWSSLDAVTQWLGKVNSKEGKFKFTEYEAVSGKENVDLPADYICEVYGNTFKGFLVDPKTKSNVACLDLKFAGIESREDGFLELHSNPELKKKRKFNLVAGSSLEMPSIQDRVNAFRKLTKNSAYWYQIVDPNKPKTSEKPVKKSVELAQSCSKCAEPLVEKYDVDGSKIIACANYPHCYGDEYDQWYFF